MSDISKEKQFLFKNLTQHHFDENCQIQNQMIKKLQSTAFCIRYSTNGNYIALGCQNGCILIYDTKQKQISGKRLSQNDSVITSLRWIPGTSLDNQILVSTNISGQVNYWQINPLMRKTHTLIQQQKCPILSMDFDKNYKKFAIAGNNNSIQLYDEQQKTLIRTLKQKNIDIYKIKRNTFSLKFMDQNTIISGSQESVVRIWDLRSGTNFCKIFGIQIAADTVDYKNYQIIAGCYGTKNQVQIYDIRKCKKLQQIDFQKIGCNSYYISSTKFSRFSKNIFATGTIAEYSQFIIYQKRNQKYQKVLGVSGIQDGIYSLDFATNYDQLAFTTRSNGLFIYDFNLNSQTD